MAGIADQSFGEKLGLVFQRCAAAYLAPDIGRQLLALVSPESLAITAAVFVAWIGSHLVGVGELIDIVIGVVGLFSVGLAVFSGLDELQAAGRAARAAQDEGGIDTAAQHLSKAIAILGIASVLALLTRGAAKTGRRPLTDPEPPRGPGLRYKPTIVRDRNLERNTGETSFWGDITIALYGEKDELARTLAHERFHQIMAPKVYLLRRFRVENRFGSIYDSSLIRYFEEFFAETFGLFKSDAKSFANFWNGLKFPVEYGYVYVVKSGGYSTRFGGKGLVPEGAALVGKGMTQLFGFEVYYKAGKDTAFDDAAASTEAYRQAAIAGGWD